MPETPAQADRADAFRAVPVDLDLDEAARRGRDRSRWPRIHWATVAAVAVGGFAGGLARYGIGLAWPTPVGEFPWAIWVVNTSGAFILGLVLVVVLEVLPPTRYVRALVGTGFCGALTTFSSVAADGDQLAAHGHAGLAVGYVLASVAAGLAAALIGIALGRTMAAHRETGRG
jgi:CrcB protein